MNLHHRSKTKKTQKTSTVSRQRTQYRNNIWYKLHILYNNKNELLFFYCLNRACSSSDEYCCTTP